MGTGIRILKLSFHESSVSLTGQPDKTWIIDADKDGFKKEELDDVMILINYKAEDTN